MTSLVVVLGLSIAAAIGAPTVARVVLSLAIAWALVELALRTKLAPRVQSLARDHRAALVLLAIVPTLVLARRADVIAEGEGLFELGPRLEDRLRLASAIQIAPPLVTSDRPQSFFVRAEGARAVRVSFESAEPIEATSLGHGVFRVELDPRAAGLTDRAPGTITATLDVDAAHHARTLAFESPLAHPRRPQVSPDGRVCAPSEETDTLFLGAPTSLTPHDVGDGPVACAHVSSDVIAVAQRYEPSLAFFDAAAQPLGLLETGDGAVAMDASTDLLAIARAGAARELVLVRLSSDETAEGIAIEGTPLRAAIDRIPLEGIAIDVALAGGDAVVTTRSPARIEVRAIDRAAPRDRSRELVMPASALAVSPDGAHIVIATTAFDPEARDNLGNHFVEDQLVWLDRETLAPLRVDATARRTDRQDHAGDADRGIGPSALAFDAEGRLFVAFTGSSELAVFDDHAPTRWLDLSDRMFGPSGVAIVGQRVIVTSAIDGGALVIDARTLAILEGQALAPSNDTLLREHPEQLRIRLGERSFWEATRAGASCASCHPGGSSDGEAHNIGGRVLAPTLDVRGLAGTAPYLRDGSYPHLGDLHDVAMLEYRGYRAPIGDRRAMLDAYLSAQPLPSSHAPRDVVREQSGLDAFFRAGCDRCHAPPAFTTLARYPLHTVFPDHPGEPALSLDVPALRNLREQAPYLFDGRAGTLGDVIDRENEANRHGDTRGLTDAQRADLVFFLETL
ncbi:MAG: hypothetical protein J0L92_12920 [Deltaproteobacteria bacterium]|nr:hypothetical protein [Deltaproteobacteria bacterium]